jgi:hypothetical protein
METKEYHLGDILSITTSHLVSPRMMDGVYDILNWMTGESLFTHQLLRAHDICGPNLLEQFPQLREVDSSEVTQKNWEKWLKEQIKKYGETFQVMRLPEGVYQPQNPVKELVDMVGQDKAIVIKTD